MATLRKRGTKSHAQVRRSGQQENTRSFTHKIEAGAWARRIEREIDRGEIAVTSEGMKTTSVGDLLCLYRDEIIPKKRSAIVEQYIINRFLQHRLSLVSLEMISSRDISHYRDERIKIVKSGTVRRELAVIRHCFEVARKDWSYPIK
jgi:hypothetical protein